jgi:hypothetical protein
MYSELPLLMVEICKVEVDAVSVAQDAGGMVRAHRANRNRAGGVRGLHADLLLFLSAAGVDQTRAAVLLWMMIGEYGRE